MPKTIRAAYGEALAQLGGEYSNVVVLDADVSSSTQSCIFREAYPERFFNVGIAESNMTAMAAGFAASGKIPFVNTFAVFLTSIGLVSARSFGSYAKLPLKLAGAYSGLSDVFDGPSHHSIEDIAVMRALPNFKIFVPSDVTQTAWTVKNAINDPGPVYLRLSRDTFPDMYKESDTFEAGKGKILREGGDATVIACGLTVGNAMEAAEKLAISGIEITVVDMFCIKPLDKKLVFECAANTGAIVTAEEHNVIGGLGGAISEALCEIGLYVPVGFIGLKDCHAECGSYAALQEKYGLDANAIINKVTEVIARK